MSVRLDSLDCVPKISEDLANGTWAAIVAHARAYEGDKVPAWNGCHDGQVWTPEQLKLMAERLEQSAQFIQLLHDLAEAGGVKIS